MKFNFNKVVPVVTGALMLGSTIGFAAGVAGQSATYPTSFASSVVVIGSASADAAAANSIAADLGKLSTGGETTVTGGHLVKKGSSVLNYGEDLQDIDDTLDDSDLATLLADGEYDDSKGNSENQESYEQTLKFVNGGNLLAFQANENNDDKAGSYLRLTDGTVAFNYSLKFTTGPTYDNSSAANLKDDFELTKLKILGDEWTITGATATALGSGPDKLTLMGGASSAIMSTGESRTLVVGGKSYDVAVTVFSSKAQFTVNGESLTVDEGATSKLSDGTNVGVVEISTSSKETVADQVEFFLGARKLVLENAQEVELNGEDVDGSKVFVRNDATNKKLKEIVVQHSPDDDVWLAAGQSWEDPVFGKFKLVFAGIKKVGEEKLSASTSTDTGKLTLTNAAGKKMDISLWDNDSDVFFGDKNTKTGVNLTVNGKVGLPSNQGDLLIRNGDQCLGSSIDRCEGVKLLVVDSQGEARIYELSKVDTGKSKLTFTDKSVAAGSGDYERDFVNGTNTLDVGLISNLVVYVNQTINASLTGTGTQTLMNFTMNRYTPTAGSGAMLETSLEGGLSLNVTGKTVNVRVYNDTTQLNLVNFTLDSDNDMQMNNIAGLIDEESGSDYKVGIDSGNYGLWSRWDSEDKDDLEMTYPGDEAAWGDVYVSPVAAVVSGGGVVPVVKDTELGDLKTTKDLVVVGGPAVNSAAAELLGLSFPTYGADAGMSVDSAMIKLFEGKLTPGKVALLVAGYEAKDTSAAAKALIAEKKFGDLTTTTASAYSFL